MYVDQERQFFGLIYLIFILNLLRILLWSVISTKETILSVLNYVNLLNELVVDKFHQRLSLAIKELEKKKKNGKIKIQEGKRNKNI